MPSRCALQFRWSEPLPRQAYLLMEILTPSSVWDENNEASEDGHGVGASGRLGGLWYSDSTRTVPARQPLPMPTVRCRRSPSSAASLMIEWCAWTWRIFRWSLCRAGEKLTPETRDWLPSFSLPSTLFALPSLAVPLLGVTRKDAYRLLVLPVTGKCCWWKVCAEWPSLSAQRQRFDSFLWVCLLLQWGRGVV